MNQELLLKDFVFDVQGGMDMDCPLYRRFKTLIL